MDFIKKTITAKVKNKKIRANASQMRFSPYRCFRDIQNIESNRCIKVIGDYLCKKENLVLYSDGNGEFLKKLLEITPSLSKNIIVNRETINNIPADTKSVFLCEYHALNLISLKKKVQKGIDVITPENLVDINWKAIPYNAWVPEVKSIYPIDVPDIEFQPNLDFILIDAPARNLSFLPNGLAYVHNALKKTKIKFQTVDLDIIVYHRYHIHRLIDRPDTIHTKIGTEMHPDPWLAEGYDEWQKNEVLEYFRPVIDEVIQKLAKAKPKIVGFSIQACNIKFVREIVNGIKKELPDTLIVVGGFSCFQPSVGLRIFPECDYMCIGEADLTVGPLIEALARGERPKDLPGILSRLDTPGYTFQNYPMPMDLDTLDMATYDWTDISLYRNYNHYQLTPIIASRGCRWSRCTFCAERFYWRVRDPKLVVDEFEYLHDHGCDLFMFNESDLNGLPEKVIAICDEIYKRGLKIKLTGQLRVHKKCNREYFDRLHRGGFVALRFGVDAWSKNGLRLQMKGYTKEMVLQNLRDCWGAGIYTEVNTVVGVPQETEADIDEGIDFMIECNPYIGRHANMNPLMLVIGSVYWEDPERFKIKFNKSKEEIFEKYHTIIPSDLWYSEDPYIDQDIRVERFKRMIKTLHDKKVDMGPFLKQVIQDVAEGKGADHSARPDLANENDTDLKQKDYGTTKRREDFAIKVASQLQNDFIDPKDSMYHIVFCENQFWGINYNEYNEALTRPAYLIYKAKMDALYKSFRQKGVPLLKNPSRLKWTARRAMEIFKEEGAKGLFFKIKNKISQHAQ
ncbi:MAG: hypothetical protein A3F16_00500 [Deltaproteobacteria bacterium RIFCSPHIGHO2_12_FULL_43_9]|nr:MAG: hypothetical protein A3F16_00500 [Deltaproteobacteria bacterium RIFCSPHIGHO2_12_FULL_43_9]